MSEFPPQGSLRRRRNTIHGAVPVINLPTPLTFAEKFGAVGNGVADDSAALQAGINAMSARGLATGNQGVLYLQPGKTYKAVNLTAASNVIVNAYGAQLIHGATGNIFTNPASNPVSNFEIRGGLIQGNNSLGSNQSGLVLRGLSNSKIVDVTINGVPNANGLFLGDSQKVWIDRCTVSQCCYAAGAGGSINLSVDANGATLPLTDVWVTNCLIEGPGSQGIAIVPQSNAVQTVGMRIRILGNTVIARNQSPFIGTTNPPAACIQIENGPTTFLPVHDVQIIGNTCDGYNPTGWTSTTSLTGTTANGSTSVTGVAGTGNSITFNGRTVSGAGIPAGTYLVTGGGTGTWTLSQPAIANGTPTLTVTAFYTLQAITVFNDHPILDPTVQKNFIITNNNCTNTQEGIVVAASNTTISNNRISNAQLGANASAGILVNQRSDTQLGGQLGSITGDTTNTSTQIVNVAGTNNTSGANGWVVTGAGIPAGTTLVSGGGTSTWTLSAAATATGVGVALTVTALTGNTTNASATVSAVAGALNTSAVNGMLARGTNITTGTYIKSGGGTSTWTLSQAATGTATGTSLTVMPQTVNNSIANNVLSLVQDTVGISVQQCSYSAVQNNLIQFATGSVLDGSEGNNGITVIYGSFVRLQGNSIDYAPENGIYLNHCNDIKVNANHVANPGEAKANGSASVGTNGIHLIDTAGPSMLVSNNSFDDTRATPVMTKGIFATAVNSIGNRATGFTGSTGTGFTTVTGF